VLIIHAPKERESQSSLLGGGEEKEPLALRSPIHSKKKIPPLLGKNGSFTPNPKLQKRVRGSSRPSRGPAPEKEKKMPKSGVPSVMEKEGPAQDRGEKKLVDYEAAKEKKRIHTTKQLLQQRERKRGPM